MSIDAVIFDLDGTAMPSSRHSMPDAVMCDAVKAANEQVTLCAATGRAWPQAKAVVEALGVVQPCVIGGGTMIVDPLEQRILWQERLESAALAAVCDILKDCPYLVSYVAGLEISPERPFTEHSIPEQLHTVYIMDVPTDSPDLQDLLDRLDAIDTITVARAGSWGLGDDGVDLHITHAQATKEHAIIELCDMLQLDRSRVAGVGDSYNDLHLFNAVGYKVAMGNAVPELKEAADVVIGDVNEQGLAEFITEVAFQD